VAAILPRFIIFLMTEIRAKVKTGEPKVRQYGRTFFLDSSCVTLNAPSDASLLVVKLSVLAFARFSLRAPDSLITIARMARPMTGHHLQRMD